MHLGLGSMNTQTPEIVILLPVFNEEKTLQHCIDEAKRAIDASPFKAEVVVVDNNSSDRSVEIAELNKVRVLHNSDRGYGANLHYGILHCGADVVFFGDSDGSYPFTEFTKFVTPIMDSGNDIDFVLGNRYSPNMEPGAMPFLNKYLGTPVLTFFINWLFKLKIKDCNCGLRAIRVSKYKELRMRSSGMEYASEMIIKAAKRSIGIQNMTFDFRQDLRDVPPHLSRWVDGWRHLRFILSNADSPALLVFLFYCACVSGVCSLVASFFPYFDFKYPLHTALALLVLTIFFSTLAISVFSVRLTLYLTDDLDCPIVKKAMALDKTTGFIKSAFFIGAIGMLELSYVFIHWIASDFGIISEYGLLIRSALWLVIAANLIFVDVLVSAAVNIKESLRR
jgi:glycosyltransferase involved in cell wall biosynthesis